LNRVPPGLKYRQDIGTPVNPFLERQARLESCGFPRNQFGGNQLVQRFSQALSVPLPMGGAAELLIPEDPKGPDFFTAQLAVHDAYLDHEANTVSLNSEN
jgi:hypothetical protein